MPIDPRTPSFPFIFISYNLNTNLFFWRRYNSTSNTPPHSLYFLDVENIWWMIWRCFSDLHAFAYSKPEKGQPEMSSVIIYFLTNLSYWHVQQQIVIKNTLKKETFLIRWCPRSVNLCVVSSWGSSQMNSRSRLIVCSPTGIVWTKPS